MRGTKYELLQLILPADEEILIDVTEIVILIESYGTGYCLGERPLFLLHIKPFVCASFQRTIWVT